MNVIHAWFEQRVAQTPDATAIKCGSQSISYQTLNNCANHLALQLLQAGAKPEMCIAICLPRSIEQIIAMLAILKSGSAYVPLDANQSSERLFWILQESESSILITSLTNQPHFNQFQGITLHLDFVNQDATPSSEQLIELEKVRSRTTGDNLAYVAYTSGSTGTPKGVMIEHRSVIHYCQWFQTHLDFSEKLVVDYSSNYIFDFVIISAIAPLMLGAMLVICSDEVKKDSDTYLRYLENEKISFIVVTPTFFKELLRTHTPQHGQLSYLHLIMLAGENLATSDCHAWLSRFKDHILVNEYGPTETTVAVTQHRVTLENIDPTIPSIPIGKPGPTMQTFIFDENRDPVLQGEIGELYIGGSCLARGYIRQPELTEESFIQTSKGKRLYKTGDLCRQNSNGDIEYIGRIDKQIKLRGYRVELNEIEIRLRQHDGIQDAIAVVRSNQNSEPLLVAYYILKPYTTMLSFVQLQNYLLTFLPDFMIPNAFVRLDSFPRTANDKLDERALPEPLMLSTQIYKAPQTPTEQLITQIWSEEIQHSRIGVLDNFFEFGGHSLLAARIIAKIAQQLGKKVSLNNFYQAPTIEQFATIVEQAPVTETNAPIVSSESRSLPLHEFQFMYWLARFSEPKVRKLNVAGRKRVQGPLDKPALDLALQLVLQKQEIFSYHIHHFYPLQTLCNKPSKRYRKWPETSLLHLSDEAIESYLSKKYDELYYETTWHVKRPWINTHLYYLNHDQVELHVCMSHLIADADTTSIFFQELTNAYLFFTQQATVKIHDAVHAYQHYVTNQTTIMQQNAYSDEIFWTDYLQDTTLFCIPQHYVVTKQDLIPSHIPLSESFILKLRQFCIQYQVGLNDVLSSAVSLALFHCCDNDTNCVPHTLAVNTLKSTRDNPLYDRSIGCFLRMDTIKLNLNDRPTLLNLAKQAQQSAHETATYQRASTLVKLASIGHLSQTRKPLLTFCIDIALSMIAKYFPKLQLNQSLINACKKMVVVDRTKQFLIFADILSSFLEDNVDKFQPDFLGLPKQEIPPHPLPVQVTNYTIGVIFHRSNDQNKPFLTIAANLTPEFQKRIGETLVSIIMNAGNDLNQQEATS